MSDIRDRLDDDPTRVSKRNTALLLPEEQAMPVCPYCGMDPLQFRTGKMLTSAGEVVFYAFCINRNCRKLLPLNMIGMEPPRVGLPRPGIIGANL